MRALWSAKYLRLTLAAALTAVLAGIAGGQQVDVRAISFGIGGGSSSPLGTTRDAYNPGFNGGAFVRFDFGRAPVALRGDFSYQNFELRRAVIPAAGSPGGGTGTLVGGLGVVQLYLRSGSVRPYLLAGGGAWSVRAEFDADPVPSHTDTRLGARAGGGVLLTFGSLLLYAEGAFDYIAARPGAPVESAIRVVPVTVGVIF